MKAISRNIFQFTLGYSNIYVIRHHHALTLVDTATPKSSEIIIKQLKQAQFDLHTIKRIIITHAHPDHIGALTELHSRTGAQIWAHSAETPIIRGEKPINRPHPKDLSGFDRLIYRLASNEFTSKLAVHRELKDAELLGDVYEGLEVVHLPGHSPGHIGLWIPSEQLLIGGDVMMNIANRLSQPLRAFTPNPQEARRSIEKVGRMKLDKLLLGHGPAILSGANNKVQKLLKQIEQRK